MTETTTTRPASNTLRLHAKIWLVTGAVLAILWLVLWLSGDENERASKKSAKAQTLDRPLPSQITSLTDFKKEVKPIDFNTVVKDFRTYSDEFKDKSFFAPHSKKYTVQVMDVMEYQIIIDYLDTRNDREKFAYFRHTTPQGEERFMLTYGIMGSLQEALGTIRTTKFELPPTAQDGMKPEEIQRVLSIIDNYQRPDESERVRDKASKKVELEETQKPTPAKPSTKPDVAPPPEPPKDIVPEEPKPTPKPAPTATPTPTAVPTPEVLAPAEPLRKVSPEGRSEPEIIKSIGKSAKELAVPPTIKPTTEAQFNVLPSAENGNGQ